MAVMLLVGSLVTLFFGLLVGSVGYEMLKRYRQRVLRQQLRRVRRLGLDLDGVGLRLPVRRLLPADEREAHFREVLPGAIVSTIALEASFQVLPIYLHLSKNVIALQAFGAPGAPARLALPDGERDRLRRRGQLVPGPRSARGGRARRSTRAGARSLFQPSSPWAHGTAVPRSKTRSFSPPAQTPIVSLSGYTRDGVALTPPENSNVLAGASLRFMTLCAPAGPDGKRTSSPRSSVSRRRACGPRRCHRPRAATPRRTRSGTAKSLAPGARS